MSDLLEYRVKELERDLEDVRGSVKRLEDEERKKLLWGITALGSVVLTLIGIIWNYRTVIFKG